jgi:hypothetical protein
MSFLASIQSALNSLTRKLVGSWFIGIIDRHVITIQSTRFAGVRFLLFLVDQPISLTERFKFISQRVKGNLDKVLIISAADIDTIFHSNIKAYYQAFNLGVDA